MLIKRIDPMEKYFNEFFDSVLLFNELMGNDVNDKSLIPLYCDLLKEEALEMKEAKTSIDEADSLIDQMVVACYLSKLVNRTIQPNYKESFADYYVVSCCIEQSLSLNDIHSALDYVKVLMTTFTTLDIDHKGALMEVANSNLSKMIHHKGTITEEQIEEYDQICVDIINQGRYSGVTWSKIGDYIIFKDGNGKLMKAPTFFEPKLAQYIY